MLANPIFLILIIAGAFFALVAFVMIALGVLTKNKATYKVGLWSLSLPVIFFGMIFIYYAVVAPWSHRKRIESYSKVYFYRQSDLNNELSLKSTGEFSCKCSTKIDIPYKGTWAPVGKDEVINFYDENGTLSEIGLISIDSQNRMVISFTDYPG